MNLRYCSRALEPCESCAHISSHKKTRVQTGVRVTEGSAKRSQALTHHGSGVGLGRNRGLRTRSELPRAHRLLVESAARSSRPLALSLNARTIAHHSYPPAAWPSQRRRIQVRGSRPTPARRSLSSSRCPEKPGAACRLSPPIRLQGSSPSSGPSPSPSRASPRSSPSSRPGS